jgi:hypothetical protein
MAAVAVKHAPISLVGILERDPDSDEAVCAAGIEVEVILMGGLRSATAWRLEEDPPRKDLMTLAENLVHARCDVMIGCKLAEELSVVLRVVKNAEGLHVCHV